MNVKFVSLCCVGLVAWMGLSEVAHAQQASAPVGVWKGKDGPADVTLSIGANGTVVYHVSGAPAVVGGWSWSQTSANSGIITIHYHITGNPYRLYYSLTRIDGNRVQMSDPFISITMVRQ